MQLLLLVDKNFYST